MSCSLLILEEGEERGQPPPPSQVFFKCFFDSKASSLCFVASYSIGLMFRISFLSYNLLEGIHGSILDVFLCYFDEFPKFYDLIGGFV